MICSPKKCTGCTACKTVCPTNAISFKEDDWGFLHPSIDITKCVKCSKCKKICPANVHPTLLRVRNTYVSVAKDISIQKESTSGGIASILAFQAIKKGWVVYGHGFDNDLTLRCRKITALNEIKALQGTKYVQSDMGDSLMQIIDDLKAGNKVLFIGTPCQVGGAINVCKNYSQNLLTVSFVCGGVPSGRLLKEYIEKYSYLKPDDIRFRSGKEYGIWLYKDSRNIKYQERWHSEYLIGFDEHIIQRESCYDCHYAKNERIGDITIGDFWGLTNSSIDKRRLKDGVSLCLITTNAGEKFFNELKKCNLIVTEKRTFVEALPENPRLSSPVIRKKEVDIFRKRYTYMGFDRAINSIYGNKYRIYRLKRRIKKWHVLDVIYHGIKRG